VVPFQLVPFAFAIGVTLLAVGLACVKLVSPWAALSLGGGAIGLCLIGIVPGSPYAIAAASVFAFGMASIGLRQLRSAPTSAPRDRRLVGVE
jgi:hypothetical protein